MEVVDAGTYGQVLPMGQTFQISSNGGKLPTVAYIPYL